METKDTRISYGAFCTWWDSIWQVGKTGGLPSCPHCRGLLYEVPDERQWFKGVDRHEANGNPGYRKMVEWGRGKCFKNYTFLKSAFNAAEKCLGHD